MLYAFAMDGYRIQAFDVEHTCCGVSKYNIFISHHVTSYHIRKLPQRKEHAYT